jgi:predicted nucleic acid-binding protein
MNAVFDSSPLIFLTKLGVIEAALDLFDNIDIPSLVYSEIRQKTDASAETVEDLVRGKRISVLKAENERFVNALKRRLGKGEAEAIALSIETGADLVILDDHAARVEAMRLGLSVKGTLGIVKRLMEKHKVPVPIIILISRITEGFLFTFNGWCAGGRQLDLNKAKFMSGGSSVSWP